MDPSAQNLDALRAFRDSIYQCFGRRADALFELTDALLSAGTVPSPVHLSLAPVHRRGWGSLYAALGRGRIDEGSLREALARHRSVGDREHPAAYAVDVSVWSRCDAEASPGRGYYYHPSRHSAGQPIVAGWAYQLVAGLSFERDSWVSSPLDARRVRPEHDMAAASNPYTFLPALVGGPPPGPEVPTAKEQCKKGGYEAFGFKNQGQCVASVQRGPKN